jgi:hypothetical protein
MGLQMSHKTLAVGTWINDLDLMKRTGMLNYNLMRSSSRGRFTSSSPMHGRQETESGVGGAMAGG